MKMLTDKQLSLIKLNTPKIIGNLIREQRLKQNLSQTQLAEAVGKDRQYMYKIECGKVTPNITTIAILAEALEISLYDLFKTD